MIRRPAECLLVLFLCAIFWNSAIDAQSKAFTLRQVMGAPFPYDLHAAPKGGAFLWVYDNQGRRNIWVADPHGAHYDLHRVTSDDADDGIEIGDIV